MTKLKSTYRVIRSIVFSVILTVFGLVVLSYVVLSLPWVQNAVREKAQSELSRLMGGKVEIGSLDYKPFNVLMLHNVSIFEPGGNRCLQATAIGAGIRLWPLVSSGRIEISFAEIIALDAKLRQNEKDGPLNIQFIIDAFKSEDKKRKTDINICLHHIVLRKCRVSFDRSWEPVAMSDCFDPNHILVYNLSADLEIPAITSESAILELRRLAFYEQSGLVVDKLHCRASVSASDISLADFSLKVGKSIIKLNDQNVRFDGFHNLTKALISNDRKVELTAVPFRPSDFSAFYPPLRDFGSDYNLRLNVEGNVDNLEVSDFTVSRKGSRTRLLSFIGEVRNLSNASKLRADVEHLELNLNEEDMASAVSLTNMNESDLRSLLVNAGDVGLNAHGHLDLSRQESSATLDLNSNIGDVNGEASLSWQGGKFAVKTKGLRFDKLDLNRILDLNQFGLASGILKGDLLLAGADTQGTLALVEGQVFIKGHELGGINVTASKEGKEFTAKAEADDPWLSFVFHASALLNNAESLWHGNLEIHDSRPSLWGIKQLTKCNRAKGIINVDLFGNSIDNMAGTIRTSDIMLDFGQPLNFPDIILTADVDSANRYYKIDSKPLQGALSGHFSLNGLGLAITRLANSALPDYIPNSMDSDWREEDHATLQLTLHPDASLYDLVELPLRPGVDVSLNASLCKASCDFSLDLDAPYLIKGKDKLIKNTKITLKGSGAEGIYGKVGSVLPLKHDNLDVGLSFACKNDSIHLHSHWQGVSASENKGDLAMTAIIRKALSHMGTDIDLCLEPSEFSLYGNRWLISPATLSFKPSGITLDGLKLHHGLEWVEIGGKVSSDPLDLMIASLSSVNLEYVFDVLNINYVDFGGIATGKVALAGLLSADPIIRTDDLKVKHLAYNGVEFGDAIIESRFDPQSAHISIDADIDDRGKRAVTVRGGLWLKRDSLSFDFGANDVDARFLKPFMSGFTSGVEGRTSGKVKLYGTFSDLDLEGWAAAHPFSMKVDHTNVWYSASDTIRFFPGVISIPPLKVYDKYGGTADFSGTVWHDHLKSASFDFSIKNARHLLVFDTNETLNSAWYGTIFANANGVLKGTPGLVSLNVSATAVAPTHFTIVLDKTQVAQDFDFLLFTDKRKENQQAMLTASEISFEDLFEQNLKKSMQETSAIFNMDLSVEVEPAAKFTLIMDPRSGDKIDASGKGAFQMHYDTETDGFGIYGKYTLASGSYNFTLEDLFLKNFKIRPGSSISFNGDPLGGILDITAAYRATANLVDLDASFRNDPDLNRTTVPVDALLIVRGEIQTPEIKFGLELPTVNAEVSRKVKSLISTEEMLNRQTLYLLALNRFYTIDYSSQANDFASAASSTLSSQIQNVVGSITDKVNVAPSFRSERSDLSDMEVDLALSSSLLNNRLLLNGNFGYRDRSTSQTTFIGDFDLEYLLSRDGSLRLKAYNHFNDASYYLKSSLTTQGIGIMYRKDFDDPFTFIKRLFGKSKAKTDSVNTKGSMVKSDTKAE